MLTSQKICLITNRSPAHPDDVASPFVRDFHLGLKEKGLDISVFPPYYQAQKIDWVDDVVRFHWQGGEKVVGSLNFFNPKELFQLFSFPQQAHRPQANNTLTLFRHGGELNLTCALISFLYPDIKFSLKKA